MLIKLKPSRKTAVSPLFSRTKFFTLLVLVLVFNAGAYLGWKGLPQHLKANFTVLCKREFWEGLTEKNNLETLDLDIKFKNYQKIEAKRRKALEDNRLISSDQDYVNATLSRNDTMFPCEIRLKGDLSDHWAGEKWSFRVKMKDENLLWGMSRFSLQKPGTRLNTSEWLFQRTLTEEDLMGLKYMFVNLRINGKPMGIYALEEHFSKEMIEKNKRREGVIVSFEEYRMWNLYINQRQNLGLDDLYRTSAMQISNSKRVEKSIMLTEQKNTALHLLRKLQDESLAGENIFSPDKTGKFLALCHFFNAEHGLMYDDINFYFDPVACLFEPIGFDGNCQSNEHSPYNYFTEGSTKKTWINYILKSPDLAHSYIFYLDKFSKPEYLNELRNRLSDRELKLRRLLLTDLIGQNASEIWSNHKSLIDFDPWASFDKRAERIRNDLSEPKPVLMIGEVVGTSDLRVIVRNALKQPVELLGFSGNSESWTAKDCLNLKESASFSFYHPNNSIVLPPFDFQNSQQLGDLVYEFKDFFKNETNETTNFSNLNAKVRILGLSNNPLVVNIPVISNSFQPDLLPFHDDSKFESMLENNTFVHESNGLLIFKRGSHLVKGDLFVPHGYEALIPPGCELLFEENAMFISRGRIVAKGLEGDPICISGKDNKWGGILLFDTKKNSVFEHVLFSKMSGVGKGPNPLGIVRSGWTTTGGMTVHRSPVSIRNCKFENCYSEDALNIISSTFLIEDSSFKNLPSDGFDGDFVSGKITGCLFENISGDGIDFSGSKVEAIDCTFSKISDKAVSVGESSSLNASYLKISDVGFGIVSKDFSKVETTQSSIKNASQAAISAYQKKKIFGPSEISCSSLSISDCPTQFLIQTLSSCKLDGALVKTISFESSSLY